MILKDTKHNGQTREIRETETWEILGWVLDCCRRHGISEVTLIYGYDWDVGDKSWADQPVPVVNVCEHVKAEEEKEKGCLGCDDLYLQINGEVQVQFCHHADVHLQYDPDDLPLAKKLRALLIEKIGCRFHFTYRVTHSGEADCRYPRIPSTIRI
ncbi:MAG TPA: hypothetical protein VLI39_12010 [Sedimentisphaerales bacterium]|nr:hypothetical protein [Sedimentisphaerales bacterium]